MFSETITKNTIDHEREPELELEGGSTPTSISLITIPIKKNGLYLLARRVLSPHGIFYRDDKKEMSCIYISTIQILSVVTWI